MKSAQEMKKITNKVIKESNCDDILEYIESQIELASLRGENRIVLDFATTRRDEKGIVICNRSLDMAIEKAKRTLIENGYEVNARKIIFIYEIIW